MDLTRIHQKRDIIDLIREFFTSKGFFELETPMLVPSPGMEVHLHGFYTQYVDHQGKSTAYSLPTSPEFALKKALGSGFEQVFEIARVFRNHGELGPQHHPEFNMLEWYRPGDYQDIMDDVEQLLAYLAQEFSGQVKDPGFSWVEGVKKRSISDCYQDLAGMDLQRGIGDPAYWRSEAIQVLDEQIPEDDSFEDIFFRVWMKLIEPELGKERPEIVYDYPASMAALSKIKDSDPSWAERFEVYVKGVELGNAFSELTDSEEQLKRFEQANEERVSLGYDPHPVDLELIQAVGRMKPTGGIAIGVERLLMALTGETDLRNFFFYPVGGANLKKN